jgi:3-hydroxybutyryl-CoA dehydrogenase
MAIQNVAVVGGGFMGSGIAQVAAQSGHAVTLIDPDPQQLEKGRATIAWSAERLHKKKFIPDDADTVLGRINSTNDRSGCADADLVIEAVYEDVAVKHEVLAELDGLCSKNTILASNTSTIPITKLSEVTQRGVIGTHFFGPVPMMKLVEIIPTETTPLEHVETVTAFCKKVGKNPILVQKDIPGFLMNRIFGAMTCEAMRLVESGAGSVEDIDQGMQDGFNMRLGPLAISDMSGLDIALNAFHVMAELDSEHMTEPPAVLKRLVEQGKLGMKTGEGFYKYDEKGRRLGPAF